MFVLVVSAVLVGGVNEDGDVDHGVMTSSCTLIISSESCHIARWLCDAREFSIISTIVKPLLA